MSVDDRWDDEPRSWALQTRGLVKKFGDVEAVAGLNLNVPTDGVHALLGPNGSGKTTTLRMLLGLIRADAGEMEILGRPVPKKLGDVIDQVGAIVESPKFTGTMSLRRNLEILACLIGQPRSRVTEVMLEVGLGARSGMQFRHCSLGMKQRVAIAATLLKRPRILIFDEPTNGLDPAGIHEIRTTMRALADAGRTVLVSSHLLGEVEQVADSLTIIGRGRVLAEGNLSRFLKGADQHVEVRADEPTKASEVLRQAGYISERDGSLLRVRRRDGEMPAAQSVGRVLGEAGIWPSLLHMEDGSLEEVFLRLTTAEHLTATQGGSPQEVA